MSRKGARSALLMAFSFIIPFFIIFIALAGLQIAPFGDHSLLISDANAYYINTLSYANRMLQGLEGITYSFKKGLGGNMMGHLNGILLTPFAFLLSLVDITQYPSAFSFISTLNLSLAGLTMYILLADICGHKRSNLIFSTCYAMMGFQTANVFQAVFFCAAPVLPIMALGLRKLIQGKNPLLYILAISYGLLSNAYFGFVICVASVLIFFAEYILQWENNKGRRLRLFIHYALSSIIGGLLVAFLWIPGFLSLQGGRLDQTSITDFHFYARQPMLEIGSKLFIGANDVEELINGRPNIYVGLLPVALVLLFFINKHIEKRKKTAAGVLLGIYLLSFTILAFDMVMHGGTTTNWFNFRYSYVFSFLILVIAAIQWKYIGETPDSDFRSVFAIMLVATVMIFFKSYAYVNEGEALLDYLILTGIFFAFRLHQKKPEQNPKKLFEIITMMLVCVSLFLNYRISILNIREWETTVTDYQKHVIAVDPIVQAVKISDDDFYRMEVNRQRSGICGNDPMLYGYNGLGHGGSNERDFVRTELYKLGVPWYNNRSYYADGVPAATDDLLGVKYVIAEEDLTEEKGYIRRITLSDWSLYENPDALPIVALSGDGMGEITTDFTSVFENLNQAWEAMSGYHYPVFIEEDNIRFRSFNMSDSSEVDAEMARAAMAQLDTEASKSSELDAKNDSSSTSNARRVNRTEKPEGCAYIQYTFTSTQDGPIYVYERNGTTDNGDSTEYSVAWLGNYKKGAIVTGYIRTSLTFIPQSIMNELCGRFRVAYVDTDALHMMSENVRSREVTVEKQRESLLTGSFTAEDDQMLFFSIPWDEGWTLIVDGQEVELKKVLGVLMAAVVDAGSHSYEMRFVPTGLNVGIKISVITLLVLVLYILLGRQNINRYFDAVTVRKSEPCIEAGVADEADKRDAKESDHDPF